MPTKHPATRQASRQVSVGKYRNLPQKGIYVEEGYGPHWRLKGEFSIVDYCTYHVLIAFIVLVVVAATVTLALLLTPKQEILRDDPNILVIIADDLGYNDVGYQGQDIKTPYIDKLAKESIKLRRHYTSPMCSPTRAALLTGRYPFRYGMSGNRAAYYGTKNGLSLAETLLPQKLKEAKYNTYMIGKWHLGFADWAMTPVRRGFDYFFGMYGGSATYRTHLSYEGPRTPGYDLFEDFYDPETGLNHRVVEDTGETFSELLYTEKAIEKIEESVYGSSGDPFFMVVAYSNPHAPIEPLMRDLEQNSHITNEKRRGMAAMITSMDYGVGRLTTALHNTHQFNKTVIIFLSDNGGHLVMPDGESLGSSNLPFRGAKGTLYEGGVRTPAFIHIPHLNTVAQKDSLTYDRLFHVTDWFHTIAKLCGIDVSSGELPLDGLDHTEAFKDILDGKEPSSSPRDHLVLDIDPVYNQAGIVQGDFKLLVGNPAPYKFDEVYPLISAESIKDYPDIVLNSTHYNLSFNMMEDIVVLAAKQQSYDKDPNHCLALECMSNSSVLYDLSVDKTESHDISWRFTHIKQALYAKLRLYANITHPLEKPLFFEDENPEALTEKMIWQPWLNSTVT